MTQDGAVDHTQLFDLLRCHSTPGNEDEVVEYLSSSWQDADADVARHGRYALSARMGEPTPHKPTLLVCAHMDSPGFAVEQIHKDRIKLVKLGGPQFRDECASAVLATRDGKVPIEIVRELPEDGPEEFRAERPDGVDFGDRACFAADPVLDGDHIASPFLDNRLGCWLLCRLARELRTIETDVNVVLGATACEELGGFGAPVLAAAIRPDLVVCVDATYEAPNQDVVIGNGPVLTLSDASVLLSPRTRDLVKALGAESAIPLQTEVYNYSGTDSRAFPHQGLQALVLPLLLATRGNHSPEETGSLSDADVWLQLVCRIAESAVSSGLV